MSRSTRTSNRIGSGVPFESEGVTANTVAIGMIDNHADPSVVAHMAARIPVKRLGQPNGIAGLCLYLVSEEASWMTGQTIQLNGGSVTT